MQNQQARDMRIAPTKIIGSIVYRTREALRGDSIFLSKLEEYNYHSNCFLNGLFSFWHFPGTGEEISRVVQKLGESNLGCVKYPSLFNFHPIRQNIGKETTYTYNLAFVSLTNSEWLTEEREEQVFAPLLRPLYNEFFNQVKRSGYFKLGFGDIPHECYEVFTTGNNQDELIQGRYGDYIDAIEVHNLSLTLKKLCDKDIERIELENKLVTEQFL